VTDPQTRWGLTIPVLGHGLAEHAEIVREAEGLGYTDLWSFETSGIDGFSPLVHAACHTTQARLGTAIVSTFTRGPAILAMSATACAQAAPGRFVLGLGASTEVIVQSWNGISYSRPVSHVRETVRRVRAALAGERMSLTEGERGSFRLDSAPQQPVPIYVAALRPGMLRLAGAIGDGVIINFLPASAVRRVLAEVRLGAEEAGRDPDVIDVVARLFVCTDAPSDERALAARFVLAVYIVSPPYAAFLRWLGLGALIEPVIQRWQAGDRPGALAAISDELVDQLLIVGDVEHARARVGEYRDAGVRVPCLAPFSGAADRGERRASVRRMGRELAPLAVQQ
jgi:probable F420-dependent oxidoreductase